MTLCALLLLATLCCAAAAAAAAHVQASDHDEFVTSPTGVRLLSSAVRAVLPPSSHRRPHDHVYDVEGDGNVVVGPRNSRVDLAATLDRASALALHPAVRARLNGAAVQAPPLFNATLRRHGPYHSVRGGARGRLLALWGPGLHLLPLDHARYPSTLLNTLRDDDDNSGVTVVNPDLPYGGGDDSVDSVPGEPRFKTPAVASDTKADCATGVIHYVELVAAFDNTFCALFGNDASAAMAVLQAAVDIAGEPYRATCVRLVLVGVDGHCNDAKDPFKTRGRGASIVDNLRSVYAQEGRRDVGRDIVVLFTGFGSTDSIGTAYVPGVCNRLGYAWIEKVNPFTLAHELGHNLGMFHIDDFDPDRPTGIMGPSGQSRKRWYFLPESIANLTRFVDHQVPGYDVSCLSTQPPACDADDCPAGCKDNKCVVNTAPGPGRISCAPAALYDCADSIDIVDLSGFIYNVKVDCPIKYDYVEAAYDANDPTLVCCLPTDATTSVMATSTLYTYINPPVSRPDGSIYENVINLADNYTLGSVTFLDTQMVPCTGKLAGFDPTPTPSPSPSGSAAPSTSASVLQSPAPSTSASAPVEPSASPSASTSPPLASESVSASPSVPASSLPPSASQSASSSALLASPSESASPSTMLSSEPSASASASMSPTETASVSVSLPASPLGSTSVAPSAALSAWTSESSSPSASTTPILSVSASPSLTPSSLGSAPSAEPSPSASMSGVAVPTASASPSVTTIILDQVDEPSASSSSSASPSVSPSVATSPSVSAAISPSSSWSLSPWETVTPSASFSWSISAVPSVSMFPSTSMSATPSQPIVLVPRELNLPTPSASYSTSASVSLMPTSSVSTSPSPAISSSVSWSVSPSSSMTMSSTPSSSTTPSRSPSPSTIVLPSSSQTPAPTQSTSATSTPTPSPSGPIPTSCGDTFTMDKHLACRKSADVTLMSESVETVRLKIFIRFGQFYYKLKGLNGHKLQGFGLVVSTSKRLRFWRVRRTMTKFASTKTVSGFYGTPIYDIPLTSLRNTCCGSNSVYSYVGVRVCSKDGEECTRLESQISMKMVCRPVCAKDASLFASSPMNAFKRCPSCEDL